MLCALTRRSRLSRELTCWLSVLAFENSFPIYPSKRGKKTETAKTSPVMSCPSPPREWKELGLSQQAASPTLAPAYCMLSWCADDNAITRISVSCWEPSGCRCLAFTPRLKLKNKAPPWNAWVRSFFILFLLLLLGGVGDIRLNLVTLKKTDVTAESSVFTVFTGFYWKCTWCPLQNPAIKSSALRESS